MTIFIRCLLGAMSFWAAVAVAQEQYRDPRSFAFEEAVTEVEEVVQTARSTVMYTDHPRGTNDPLFIAQELLGRPTDTAVTVNAAALSDLEAYYEFGTEPGSYEA